MILITYQVKNIFGNSTTSENLRSEIISIPDFNNGCYQNLNSFNNEIFSYKKDFTYNKGAISLLKKSILLYQYIHDTSDKNRNITLGNIDSNETYDTIDYKSTSVSL